VKVMLIGPLPPPIGGTAVSFKMLFEELQGKTDVQVFLINTNYRGSTNYARRRWLVSQGVCFVRVTVGLLKNVKNCDVVTLHASYPGTIAFGPVALLICRLYRKPFILREFGGIFDNEDKDGSWFEKLLVAFMFTASGVLLQTKSLIEYFRNRFPKANCVWYSNSRPSENRRHQTDMSGHRRFVFIGHVKPTKGIREILMAAALLSDHEFEIDIYGPLMDGIDKNEFDGIPRVRYKGILNPDSVSNVLRNYDMLLLPSYHDGEGYPGIILEGFMLGIPCIATRWRSIPEIVVDGKSGLLIEPRSAKSLADGIGRILESPQLLLELSEGAWASGANFDSAHWTARFVEVCGDVIKEHARRDPETK
jgi:glycosyltransferase involved in cell wall biosynthesis